LQQLQQLVQLLQLHASQQVLQHELPDVQHELPEVQHEEPVVQQPDELQQATMTAGASNAATNRTRIIILPFNFITNTPFRT
jgi:hypothetical protein